MKLCQFWIPGRGRRVGVLEGDDVIDVTSRAAGVTSVLAAVARAGTAERLERLLTPLVRGRRPRLAYATLDRAPSPRHPHLLVPIDAPEVWGAGITYRRSMQYYEAHTGDTGRTRGIYDHVYEAERPELFFKATPARIAGPRAPVGLRGDSRLTAVEAELAFVLGAPGRIVGYTIGNDLSAWDIERENPLFLPQSKIFDGCFAMGPVLVTPSEIRDPHLLDLAVTIRRGDRVVFRGGVNTKEMKRRVEELADWLGRFNPLPAGTVVSTGTGILVPDDAALAPGDVVDITLERVGRLVNPVRSLA